METLTSIIADDHPLFRLALQQAVSELIGDKVTHTDNLETTLDALHASPDTDLLFLDLKMPGNEGLKGLLRISAQFPDVSIIIVSAEESTQVITRVMKMGACAFIPKSSKLEEMAEAVRHVLDGEYWVPSYISVDVIDDINSENDNDYDGDFDQQDIKQKQLLNEQLQRLSQLTPNQHKVLKLMADGLLNKQIAYELSISESTVKQHSSQVLKKLGLNNRTQAGVIYKDLI